MSRRTARWLAASILFASLVATMASIPISLGARDRIHPGQIVVVGNLSTPGMHRAYQELQAQRAAGDPLEATTGGFDPATGILMALLVLWIGIGALIVARQPDNWARWVFLITGAPFPLLSLSQALVIYAFKARPGSVPLVGVWAVLGEYALYPIALLPLLFMLYPDGHPPSPRWRWAVGGLVGGTAVAAIGFAVRPGPYNNWIGDGILYENPFGIDALASVSPVIISAGTIVALISGFSSVVAVRQRFKRSTGEERQRMRVLVFVASLAGTFFALQWILGIGVELVREEGPTDEAPIFTILFGLTAFTLVAGIPLAYAVAIFRYRLYDLDLVIKKTVQYGVLVAAFLLLGFLIVVAIPALLVGVDGASDVLPVLLLASALTAMFLLIRPRAARLANRLVYGRRATPYEVLSEFSDRVGETYSTEDVLPRMTQLVAEATGARRVAVWLRTGSELRSEASFPLGDLSTRRRVQGEAVPAGDGEYIAEVRHQGELLGAITLEPAADDPMTPAKEALVRDLAAQAGLVLRNVRLIEELRASRQRLVAAQDQERRKLERNIHDGVQQQLVALSVQLKLARTLLGRDAEKAGVMLDALQGAATETLEDLRDLARGIYPPLLADQGLPPALQAQARKAVVPTKVSADGVGRYSQDVESAVYFSVLEALNNVAKYAHARSASVSLQQRTGSLEFRVRDDGRGFDATAASYGTGLQGIVDRLDAIGGSISIASSPGEGTTLSGSVPVEPIR